jgi:hypothetical protein
VKPEIVYLVKRFEYVQNRAPSNIAELSSLCAPLLHPPLHHYTHLKGVMVGIAWWPLPARGWMRESFPLQHLLLLRVDLLRASSVWLTKASAHTTARRACVVTNVALLRNLRCADHQCCRWHVSTARQIEIGYRAYSYACKRCTNSCQTRVA